MHEFMNDQIAEAALWYGWLFILLSKFLQNVFGK